MQIVRSEELREMDDPEISAAMAVMSGMREELFASEPTSPLVRKKVFSMTRAMETSAGEEIENMTRSCPDIGPEKYQLQ